MSEIEFTPSESETKIKILLAAQRLFSQYGYDGASIRDIARESEVNLAAINYHFKNKENLFWSIINESFNNAERVCAELAKKSDNLHDFAMSVFDHFQENRDLMRNTMKLLLSQRLSPPESSPCSGRMAEGQMGPPGGQYFAEFLSKEMPFALSQEATLWGVKSIFGTIVHWTTMCASAHFESCAVREPLMRPEQIRKDVARIVRSTTQYIQNNKAEFGL